MTVRCVFSEDRVYRYLYINAFEDDTEDRCVFIMLNPSTADEYLTDPTIRKCIGFSKRFGFKSMAVVNLFAYRAVDPKTLRRKYIDPIGPENDTVILKVLSKAKQTKCKIVCAWGNNGDLFNRNNEIYKLLIDSKVTPYCFGVTKPGEPRHPVRLGYNTPLTILGPRRKVA